MVSSDAIDYKRVKKEVETLVNVYNKTEEVERRYLRPYLNDPIVVDVIERVKTRADKGMQKYGVAMTRTDTTTVEWLRHAQEEALDLAVYLERCIRDLEEPSRV